MTTFTTVDDPLVISLAERAVLSRTVAPVTGKGGILKTATICAIAVTAAMMGMSVLMIDMDGHGVASQRDMGLRDTGHNDQGKSLATALMMTFMGTPTAPTVVESVLSFPQPDNTDGTPRPPGRVDVIVGGKELDGAIEAISALADTQRREYRHVLGKVVAQVAPGYHLVLMDNNPTNKAVRLMVLEAAAFSYAPVDYDIAAYFDGLGQLTDEMAEVRARNPQHVFLGAVAGRMPTATIYSWKGIDKNGKPKVDRSGERVAPGGAMVEIAEAMQTILANEVFDAERTLLGPGHPKIFEAMIRSAPLEVSKARKSGQTIITYAHEVSEDPENDYKILNDYRDLVNELMIGMAQAHRARAAAAA